MNLRAIPLIVVLTAFGSACGGSSSRHSVTPPPSGLPDPQTYAARMDAKERYWWQQPERVVELLRCAPGMTVVDLGAGTGYFLPYLSSAVGRSGRVLALDVERSMVDIIFRRVERERLFNVSPRLVHPDDPALTPRSVDRVLVVNTWHHLTDRVAYAKKLLEALRPGGLVLVVDFDENSPEGPPVELRLSPSTVVTELESAGLSTELLGESLPYQYAIAARIPEASSL
ncbi:MAG: class I SAM-dependent methyltransferase [Myxococcales bacterium]|nr:class I SAM-dependent methyltransferase [Myxococcales bacterium]MDH3483973.1 class I SAM-dependent methyltransferase [Myxococcales bacterium]